TLDLGRVRDIGPIDFWPAMAPHLLALSAFGFPEKISVELSTDPDFKKAGVFGVKNASGNIHRGDLFSVKCEGYDARYVRITMEGLREYKGKRILGLGEISVSQNEKVWSIDCKVTAQGIPMEDLDQLPRLVDGCSRQRRILPQGEWIKGLALRRPLDRRLAVVERELELAQAAWRRIKQRSGIWAGSIVFMGLVGGLVVQQRMRKRGMKKLKWRIARDLHDDVGSNLGSISLVAERLENDVPDAGVKEDLSELSLLAREASASLRDVVWVIDQGVIRLPELIQKLVERAERVLHGVELSVEIPPDCPDTVVPLTFKRHLIMFFKEAVHNCARHANASQVQIAVSIEEKQLRVRIADNGCGFDPPESSGGWGLNSMKERAQELGGEMELKTRRGEGTTVVLKIPLEALSREPNRAYKSSN
ncbi:MAG: sensor histidine kinase, partial [Verrucomicrobia bacterium]|nr:sensor histidine kinase [Verrucomicrobiota bacterium]